MKKVLLGCAAICLLFSACKKGDSSSKSRPEILKTGSWMVTAQKSTTTANGIAGPETDDYAAMSSCEKDDLTKFRSDMHLISDEGATKCNSSDPQETDEGIWALTTSDTKLTLTDGTDVLTADILQLDDNTLKFKISESEVISGVTLEYATTITFTHK